jgi:hypothetical protein
MYFLSDQMIRAGFMRELSSSSSRVLLNYLQSIYPIDESQAKSNISNHWFGKSIWGLRGYGASVFELSVV